MKEEWSDEMRAVVQNHQDKLHKIYEDSVDELTEEYKEYVGKVGIISLLVGILVGIGIATLIEVMSR